MSITSTLTSTTSSLSSTSTSILNLKPMQQVEEKEKETFLILKDSIWGEFKIIEPVLLDLIKSAPVQRLKGVLQHGISSLFNLTSGSKITRYEHSIGVMLLVRKLGGSLEAQASALLHDIAHTALSHVVDSSFSTVIHETHKLSFLSTTSIPSILTSHNLSPSRVLNEELFPLLEMPAPGLCADRVDYGLRDSVGFGVMHEGEKELVVDDLREWSGRICCGSEEGARVLAKAYLKSDKLAWSNPLHSLLYLYAASTISLAHSLNLLPFEALWSSATDELFWSSLTESSNEEVRGLAGKVREGLRVREIEGGEEERQSVRRRGGEVVGLKLKVRVLDPEIAIYSSTTSCSSDEGTMELALDSKLNESKGAEKSKIIRTIKLTELDPAYKLELEVYKESKKGERWFEVY